MGVGEKRSAERDGFTGRQDLRLDASEQAEYRKLYQYNLAFTGESAGSTTSHPPSPGSPLGAMLGGPSGEINPEQLRAALTIGIASTHQKPMTVVASLTGEPKTPSTLRIMFWIVIALSAGAIAAALVLT